MDFKNSWCLLEATVTTFKPNPNLATWIAKVPVAVAPPQIKIYLPLSSDLTFKLPAMDKATVESPKVTEAAPSKVSIGPAGAEPTGRASFFKLACLMVVEGSAMIYSAKLPLSLQKLP
ncbi:hypothetical protein WICPIJ_001012 [Wickerhamomyces pijperi]|uniref:Uncharacterized protein n=1 Tax=Wickerhamomyces pijperi TaxID=599730 RepID=A0A9P8QCJ5_WICPI|nr:hypothetical protein WICPIJ_001012 [Wickerhamomyces pijperi]